MLLMLFLVKCQMLQTVTIDSLTSLCWTKLGLSDSAFLTIMIVAETIITIFESITIVLFQLNCEIVNSTNKGSTIANKLKQRT